MLVDSRTMKKNDETKANEKKLKQKNKANRKYLTEEDAEILLMLEEIKINLEQAYSDLDFITEPLLIDSNIYEIQSLQTKYQYYIKLCKEKKLIASGF